MINPVLRGLLSIVIVCLSLYFVCCKSDAADNRRMTIYMSSSKKPGRKRLFWSALYGWVVASPDNTSRELCKALLQSKQLSKGREACGHNRCQVSHIIDEDALYDKPPFCLQPYPPNLQADQRSRFDSICPGHCLVHRRVENAYTCWCPYKIRCA